MVTDFFSRSSRQMLKRYILGALVFFFGQAQAMEQSYVPKVEVKSGSESTEITGRNLNVQMDSDPIYKRTYVRPEEHPLLYNWVSQLKDPESSVLLSLDCGGHVISIEYLDGFAKNIEYCWQVKGVKRPLEVSINNCRFSGNSYTLDAFFAYIINIGARTLRFTNLGLSSFPNVQNWLGSPNESLEIFDLSNNNLSKIPSEIGLAFKNLRTIRLLNNPIRMIPDSIPKTIEIETNTDKPPVISHEKTTAHIQFLEQQENLKIEPRTLSQYLQHFPNAEDRILILGGGHQFANKVMVNKRYPENYYLVNPDKNTHPDFVGKLDDMATQEREDAFSIIYAEGLTLMVVNATLFERVLEALAPGGYWVLNRYPFAIEYAQHYSTVCPALIQEKLKDYIPDRREEILCFQRNPAPGKREWVKLESKGK
jgi:hypothetical protein